MRTAGLLLGMLLVAGCGALPGGSTAPQPTAQATPQATAQPSIQPTSDATPGADGPPAGLLSFGDDTVEGWLGTYCWESDCVDVPQQPDIEELPFLDAPGDLLTFTLDGGAAFVEWSASYIADDEAAPLGQGGSYDPDSNQSASPDLLTAAFTTPPAGDHVVSVRVTFSGGGDAAYYWHVAVE